MNVKSFDRGVVVAEKLSKVGNKVGEVAKGAAISSAMVASTGYLAVKSTTKSTTESVTSFFAGMKVGFSGRKLIR